MQSITQTNNIYNKSKEILSYAMDTVWINILFTCNNILYQTHVEYYITLKVSWQYRTHDIKLWYHETEMDNIIKDNILHRLYNHVSYGFSGGKQSHELYSLKQDEVTII